MAAPNPNPTRLNSTAILSLIVSIREKRVKRTSEPVLRQTHRLTSTTNPLKTGSVFTAKNRYPGVIAPVDTATYLP